MSSLIYKRKGYGRITAVAGTVITRLVEPMPGLFTSLAETWYINAGTAHALTVMRPLGKTFASAAAAAAQAVINIAQNPGTYSNFGTINTANNNIAANDYVVYQSADGNYNITTVSSVATLAITLAGNVPTAGVLKGAPFWFFGITTDTNPADNLAHPAFTLTASATTKLFGIDPGDTMAGGIGSIAPAIGIGALYSTSNGAWPLNGQNEPIILHSDNATAAGTLEKVTAVYSNLA